MWPRHGDLVVYDILGNTEQLRCFVLNLPLFALLLG